MACPEPTLAANDSFAIDLGTRTKDNNLDNISRASNDEMLTHEFANRSRFEILKAFSFPKGDVLAEQSAVSLPRASRFLGYTSSFE
jgi:hypothetical protein